MGRISGLLQKLPAGFEAVRRFLQKGAAVETDEPALAYGCLYHAAYVCAKKPSCSGEEEAFLASAMDLLEEASQSVSGQDQEPPLEQIRKRARALFQEAKEGEDDGGLKIGRLFIEGALWFDVLSSLDGQKEDAEMGKYSKWKGLELIRKERAAPAGRDSPGPLSALPSSPRPAPTKDLQALEKPLEKKLVDIALFSSAATKCKLAMNAIDYKDTATAIKYLENAISYLRELEEK